MFGKNKKQKNREPEKSYDPAKQTPIVKCNTCNRDMVAGFRDAETGKFEEVMPVQSEYDLDEFRRMYGISRDVEIPKKY